MTGMDTFVWLAHLETGNKAQFSVESAEIWRQRGWVDTDAPVPADPTTAHLQAEPVTAEPPAVENAPPPADEGTPKTTRRSSGNSAEKEQA